jgi:hypothetical protein
LRAGRLRACSESEEAFTSRAVEGALIDKRNRCAEVRLKMESDMIIGYARVSTDGQTLDAQQSALAAAGAEKVFAEKVSGAVTDRKALERAIVALGAGDVLLVTRGWIGSPAAPATS